MYQHILLAYDGTPAADAAFSLALELVRPSAGPLHAVSVAFAAEVETHVMLEREHERCQALLHALQQRAQAQGVALEPQVVDGIPAQQIVAVARRLGADLLVIGHRQRGVLRRMAEGSVAKRVIDHAHCPVLVAS